MFLRSVIPLRDRPSECLSDTASQGLVFAIDSDFVLKLPYQYPIPDHIDDDDTRLYMDRALQALLLWKGKWQSTMHCGISRIQI